jgi:hypothetical protein
LAAGGEPQPVHTSTGRKLRDARNHRCANHFAVSALGAEPSVVM